VNFNGNGTAGTYSGNVAVSTGVLALGKNSNILGTNGLTFSAGAYTGASSSSFGSQTVTVTSGAAVALNEVNAAYTEPQNYVLNGAGTGATGLGAAAALDADNVGFGNATIGNLDIHTNSTVQVDANATATTNVGLQVGVPWTYVSGTTTNGVTSGGLAGAGNLTKTGTGALILSGAAAAFGGDAAFTGNINVNTGVILVGNGTGYSGADDLGSNASGSQTVTVASGASVVFNDANHGAQGEPDNFILNGTGTGSSISGILGANAALQVYQPDFGDDGIGKLVVATNSTIETDDTVNPATDLPHYGPNWGIQVSGLVYGTGTLTKTGNGALYLLAGAPTTATPFDGYSAFSGNVNVQQGILDQEGTDADLGLNGLTYTINGSGDPVYSGTTGTQTITVSSGASFVIDGRYDGRANIPQNLVLNGTGTGVNVAAWNQNSPPTTFAGMSLGVDAALDVYRANYHPTYLLGGLAIATNSAIRVNTATLTAQWGLEVQGPLAGTGNLSIIGQVGDVVSEGYFSNSSIYNGWIEFNATAGAVGSYSAYTGNVTLAGGALGGAVMSLGKANDALGTNASGTQTVTVNSGSSVVLDEGQAAGHA